MLEGRIHGQQYAPSTCNRALAILKTMGRYALRQDVLEKNEADKIPLLKENNQRTRFLTPMRSEGSSTLRHDTPIRQPGTDSHAAVNRYTQIRNAECHAQTY